MLRFSWLILFLLIRQTVVSASHRLPPGISCVALVDRSLIDMTQSLASTIAKVKCCHPMPMSGIATTNVEMTCLQGLADLERLEGPWLDGLVIGDPEVAATTVRLLLAHLTWNSKRLLGEMVLDGLDVELATTRLDADVCHAAVNNNSFCQPLCQQGNDSSSATA